MENSELIKDFKKGNEKAFDLLIKNNQAWVQSLIRSIVSNEFESEDIAQDVFVNVYFSVKKFRFQSSFKTWLYRIIINRINNYYRKEKLRSIFNLGTDNLESTVDNIYVEKDRNGELYKMTYKLPRIQRNVVILKVFQDLHYKDISKILNITVNSAKVSMHKAKVNLKRMTDG